MTVIDDTIKRLEKNKVFLVPKGEFSRMDWLFEYTCQYFENKGLESLQYKRLISYRISHKLNNMQTYGMNYLLKNPEYSYVMINLNWEDIEKIAYSDAKGK